MVSAHASARFTPVRVSRWTRVLAALIACLAGPAIWGAATAHATLTVDKDAVTLLASSFKWDE